MDRVVWSSQARADAEAIAAYIGRDSASASRSWMMRVLRAVEQLEAFPRSGRIVPEYGDADIRELLVGDYRVIYRIVTGGVEIAEVYHGAQLLD